MEELPERRFFSLSAVTRRINELLQPAIGKQFWIKAEVSSGRERGGAFYCDLVETDANGKITAKLACTLWQSELLRIRALFKARDMDLVLENGTIVGFLCSLQYSPQYGLSLRVVDADPAFALGEMELRKREIIERLQREGLFARNKERPVPLLPLRLGFITSAGSAAYNDFIQTLSASGFGFKIWVADAMVQGDQTERSVLKALDRLGRLDVELIVIARGGGSKTDLSFLDNEAIARKIAESKFPVWTGIGHEIDTSVLDYVANRSFKTPTAVAEELVARFVQMRRQLDESANTLKTVWAYQLKTEQEYLDRSTVGIQQGSRKLLDVTASTLRERAQSLRLRVSGRITNEQLRRKGREERLRAVPMTLLKGSRESLLVRRQNMASRARFVLSHAATTFAALKQRFDRDRFLRRVQVASDNNLKTQQNLKNRFVGVLKLKQAQHQGLVDRFRVEKIRQRLTAESRSLSERMAILRASDPQRVLERGFALVYRQDGRLLRSVHDVSEKDRVRTHLADGAVISEVISKEEKP